ncbi:MAG: hypothetical protein GKR94_25780 [Gammaproteobacteria bacterium]|nr:hypothetical protein [Gammaproteobacteria bacterium]
MRDEYDFSNATRAHEVAHLKRLREEAKGKTRITIMLDNDVLASFKRRSEAEGIGYQTLINQTLRRSLGTRPIDEETLRKVLREELSTS